MNRKPSQKTLSGLSQEVVRDVNGNIYFNGDADEIFMNAAAGDFRLKGSFAAALQGLGASVPADIMRFMPEAGSPAIGMGVPIPEVKTDITGYPRDPVHPTIGALEYRGSPSDGPPVIIQELEPPAEPTPWEPEPTPPQATPVPTEVIQETQELEQHEQASKANVGMIALMVAGGAILADVLSDD